MYAYINIIINCTFVIESLRCINNIIVKHFFMKPMMENKFSSKIYGKNFVKPLFKQKFVFCLSTVHDLFEWRYMMRCEDGVIHIH